MSGSLCFACGFDAEGSTANKADSPLAPPVKEPSEPILLEEQLAPEMHDAIFDAGLDLEADPFQPRSTEPQWKMSSAQAPSNGGFTDDHDPFRSRDSFDPFAEGADDKSAELPDDMGIDVDLKSGAFELKSGAFDLENDRQEIGRSGAFEILAEAKLPDAAAKLPPPIPQDFDPFADSTEPFAKVPEAAPSAVSAEVTGAPAPAALNGEMQRPLVDLIAKLSGLAQSLSSEGRGDDAELIRDAITRLS